MLDYTYSTHTDTSCAAAVMRLMTKRNKFRHENRQNILYMKPNQQSLEIVNKKTACTLVISDAKPKSFFVRVIR